MHKRLQRKHASARVIQRSFRLHLFRQKLLDQLSRFLNTARRTKSIIECNSGTSVDSARSFTTPSPVGIYLDLGVTIQTAMHNGKTLYLVNRLTGAKYLEYNQRILSKRRLPRVCIENNEF